MRGRPRCACSIEKRALPVITSTKSRCLRAFLSCDRARALENESPLKLRVPVFLQGDVQPLGQPVEKLLAVPDPCQKRS